MKTIRSSRTKKRLSTVKLTSKKVCLIFFCFFFLFNNPVLTIAEPNALAQKKEEMIRVKSQLANIDNQLDYTVEKYNQANINLSRTREEIQKTKEHQWAAAQKLCQQKELFRCRLINIYRSGDINFVSALVGTRSFVHFLTRLSYLIQISNHDLELLQEIQSTKKELEETKLRLEKQEAEQIAITNDLKTKRNSIEGQISDRKAYLATIQTDIRLMINREEAQEARTRASEAQTLQRESLQQREQEQRAREDSPNNPAQRQPNNNPTNSADNNKKPSAPPPSAKAPKRAAHSEVLAIAMQQLGKPYQWGAGGPNSFDCSGLVMYCYAQIGISLPHSAGAQYSCGARLDKENLSPGDLVFFGTSGVSHVGIYVGGGQYIHAPRTGDFVKVSGLSSRQDYYGACRP